MERVSHGALPGSNALPHRPGERGCAPAEPEEGPEPGGGSGHRRGTRHRPPPGQGVREAGRQEGESTAGTTCCTRRGIDPLPANGPSVEKCQRLPCVVHVLLALYTLPHAHLRGRVLQVGFFFFFFEMLGHSSGGARKVSLGELVDT